VKNEAPIQAHAHLIPAALQFPHADAGVRMD
jgi:hypothetical protein